MPPTLIQVPREPPARVLQHAASRASADPAEARAWEALQATLDSAAKPSCSSTLVIRVERPSTVGAMLDALRADMDRLGVVHVEVGPRRVFVMLRAREG